MTISYVEVHGGTDPFDALPNGQHRYFCIAGNKWLTLTSAYSGRAFKLRMNDFVLSRIKELEDVDWKLLIQDIEAKREKGKLQQNRWDDILQFCRSKTLR